MKNIWRSATDTHNVLTRTVLYLVLYGTVLVRHILVLSAEKTAALSHSVLTEPSRIVSKTVLTTRALLRNDTSYCTGSTVGYGRGTCRLSTFQNMTNFILPLCDAFWWRDEGAWGGWTGADDALERPSDGAVGAVGFCVAVKGFRDPRSRFT